MRSAHRVELWSGDPRCTLTSRRGTLWTHSGEPPQSRVLDTAHTFVRDPAALRGVDLLAVVYACPGTVRGSVVAVPLVGFVLVAHKPAGGDRETEAFRRGFRVVGFRFGRVSPSIQDEAYEGADNGKPCEDIASGDWRGVGD